MLHNPAVLQGMPVGAACSLEKGDSYIYNAVAGAEIELGRRFEETGISVVAALLFGFGGYEFLSGPCSQRAHSRLLVDAARHFCAGFCDMSGDFGGNVGGELPFQ